MLELLRGSVSGWVAKIFIGLLVLSFGVWGIADVFRVDAGGAVVTVGETKVTAGDYNQIYRRNLNTMSQRFGTQLTPEQARSLGIEVSVLGEIVSGAVLDENARILNLGLSDQTLAVLIGKDPAFRGFDGNFSRDRFQQAIRNAQMREDDYINGRNKVAVRNQIFEATARGDILPKVFYQAAADYTEESRKFDFIQLTAENLNIDPKPAVDDVEKYFKANKAIYAAPEYRKISILKVEPSDVLASIEIDDDAVKQDYDSRKDKYGKAERRRVQQIVFKDKAKAEEAAKSLADGTLFETLIEELKLKIEDLDLGLVKESALPDKKIAEAAFSLELNSTSGVIDGTFGPVIVRATEIEPETITPFEEVKEAIKKDLALAKATDEVISLQDAIEDMRAGGATLGEIASKNGLKLRVVDAVDATGKTPKDETIGDLPNSAQLLRAVFQAEAGEETDYLNVGSSGYAWFDLNKIIAARERTFDEVKERVNADWRTAEIAKALGAKATELKESLTGGKSMLDIAAEIGSSVQSTSFLKRSESVPQINANAVRSGFSGADGNVSISNGITAGSQILLKVAGIKVPDAATLPAADKTRIDEAAGNDVLEQLVDQLRNRYGVEINQPLIQLAQGQR